MSFLHRVQKFLGADTAGSMAVAIKKQEDPTPNILTANSAMAKVDPGRKRKLPITKSSEPMM